MPSDLPNSPPIHVSSDRGMASVGKDAVKTRHSLRKTVAGIPFFPLFPLFFALTMLVVVFDRFVRSGEQHHAKGLSYYDRAVLKWCNTHEAVCQPWLSLEVVILGNKQFIRSRPLRARKSARVGPNNPCKMQATLHATHSIRRSALGVCEPGPPKTRRAWCRICRDARTTSTATTTS